MAEILEMGSGGGGSGTGIYFVLTYAQAQFLKSTNSLVPGATYRITSIPIQEFNCEIVVKAEENDNFSVNGDFYRSNGNIDSIVWHFDSNLITERKDAKNNHWRARTPFTSYLYSIDWDHPNFEGNTIINTALTFSADPNAYFKDNYFEDNFGTITFTNLGKNAQVFANKIIGMNGLNANNSDARFNSNECLGSSLDIQNSVFLDGDISGCNLFNSSIQKGKKCSILNSYLENGNLNIISAEQKLVIVECFFKNNTTSAINIIGIVTSINIIRSDFEGQLNLNFDSNCTIQSSKFNNLSTALSLASRSNYTNYFYQTNDKSNIDSIETTFSSNTLDFNSLENGNKTGIVKLNSWSGVGYPYIDRIINSENIEIEILNNGTFNPYLLLYSTNIDLINANGYIVSTEKYFKLKTNQFLKLIKGNITNSFGTFQVWIVTERYTVEIPKTKKYSFEGGFAMPTPNNNQLVGTPFFRNSTTNVLMLTPGMAGKNPIVQLINQASAWIKLQTPNSTGSFFVFSDTSTKKYYIKQSLYFSSYSTGDSLGGFMESPGIYITGGFGWIVSSSTIPSFCYSGSAATYSAPFSISLNTWYDVEVEYEYTAGNMIARLFVDGKLVAISTRAASGFSYNCQLIVINAGGSGSFTHVVNTDYLEYSID